MPVKKSSIRFHYTDQRFRFPDRTALKAFLVQLAKREGSAVEDINYIFCSDEYLLKINQEQLQHDTYTDIITFPYSGKGAFPWFLTSLLASIEYVTMQMSLGRRSYMSYIG
jgi:probable rRNA maturation factor